MNNLPNSNDSAASLLYRTRILAEIQRRNTEKALKGGVESLHKQCKTLHGFVRAAWTILEPGTIFKDGDLIAEVCKHLEAVTRGECTKLLINIPPGTMKSLLVSVLWPAWEWGPAGKPHLRYLSTSFDDRITSTNCRKMRDLVLSEWYQALWPLRLTRKAEIDFANEYNGTREGAAFPSLTGKRGDRLIIDDPHSTETAESDADRAHAIRIFRESVPLRINDPEKSAIVIIMQRLHQHDVSGVALALKLGYVHLMLPMEFEPDRKCITPFGGDWRTKPGQLLFPERFTEDIVKQIKVPMGAYGVAGQLQQRPSARGGIMFQRAWFKVISAPPVDCRWIRGWDLAATEKKTKSNALGPAYTAGVKLGRTSQGRFIVAHVVRMRGEGAAVRSAILNTATADGRHCEIDLPQDPGQAGKTQAQDMVAMLAGYKAFASVESGEKETRAQPVAAQAEAGNIDVVEGAWNEDFFGELELFPTGAYKDQVDALSRAFARFVRGGNVSMTALPMLFSTPRHYFGDHPGV